MTLTITQGTTRTVTAADIVDAAGAPLVVTGWSVRAVIRRGAVAGPVVADWSTTPTGSQGQAAATGSTVTLSITPAMSAAWTWTMGRLHCEITEPGPNGRVERIIDEHVYLDPEAVL
ncbi:MAG: hypothetical protein ACRDRC_01755 [Pseudonocardiaceae bacterium]